MPSHLPYMRQLRCRPPSQLSLLSEARRSACGTALPRKQTGSRHPSQLSYAAQPVNKPGGPFPRPWISSPPGITPLQPIARHNLTTYPPDFAPPRVEAHLPPCNLTPLACSPGFGAACLFPPCSFKICFPRVFCLVFSSARLWFGFCAWWRGF